MVLAVVSSQSLLAELDGPDAVVGCFHADEFPGKRSAQVMVLPVDAKATGAIDVEGLEVHRVLGLGKVRRVAPR